MKTYDVCIVGAGAVGCAIARELAHRRQHHPLRIIVLEQHEAVARETSGRNSGVLHSGIHEPPGSLKSRLAAEGSVAAVAYATARGLPLLTQGMIIAISGADLRRGLWREALSLIRLWRNARRSKTQVSLLTAAGLRAREPHLRARLGLFIPSVAVIDPVALVESLHADAKHFGVEFAFSTRVAGVEADDDGYRITTDREPIRATCLINAAGLRADDVAALALGRRPYAIHPLRGEYYEIVTAEKRHLITRLVYPALPRHAAGKGIHFSPRPDGRMFVGPNTVPVDDPTDYTSRKTPPDVFVDALRKFLPSLHERDLRWAYAGIRPRLAARDGGTEDFIIAADREDPPLVNLIGIESPGLSAALAIARHVADLPCLHRRLGSLHAAAPSPHDAREC